MSCRRRSASASTAAASTSTWAFTRSSRRAGSSARTSSTWWRTPDQNHTGTGGRHEAAAHPQTKGRALMIGGLTGWHLLIILAVILLLFGAPKLPALARSIGQSMRIFKGEVDELKKDGAP